MMFYPSPSNNKGLLCNTNIRSHENKILRKEISSSLLQEHKDKNEKMTDSITLSNNMNAEKDSIKPYTQDTHSYINAQVTTLWKRIIKKIKRII